MSYAAVGASGYPTSRACVNTGVITKLLMTLKAGHDPSIRAIPAKGLSRMLARAPAPWPQRVVVHGIQKPGHNE